MSAGHRAFIERIVIALALVALALALWTLSGLLILVFAAIVVAVVLNALARPLARHTPLSERVALILVVIVLALAIVAAGWAFGAQLGRELRTLQDTLPAAWATLQQRLAQSDLGSALQDTVGDAGDAVSEVVSRAGTVAMSLGGGIANLVVVLVGAVYLAAQPRLYRGGLLQLLPRTARPQVADALDDSGRALRLWLAGQFVAMLAVGVLTGLGLWALGVPAALGLAIIATLFDFVPLVGPILAALPAILLALTVDPRTALLTTLLYLVVQQIEGNLLQPLVQQRAVELPPALLLFALIGAGLLFGALGVLLAAPLTVVAFVLVKRLYVRETLGEETDVPGETS